MNLPVHCPKHLTLDSLVSCFNGVMEYGSLPLEVHTLTRTMCEMILLNSTYMGLFPDNFNCEDESLSRALRVYLDPEFDPQLTLGEIGTLYAYLSSGVEGEEDLDYPEPMCWYWDKPHQIQDRLFCLLFRMFVTTLFSVQK